MPAVDATAVTKQIAQLAADWITPIIFESPSATQVVRRVLGYRRTFRLHFGRHSHRLTIVAYSGFVRLGPKLHICDL